MAPSTVTVLYPALKEGERFDVEYYVTKHLELAVGAWKSLGMKDFQVVKFGAAAGGDTLPYSVAAFITFDSPEGVGKAMASPLTKGVFEDTPNFTNTKPLVLLGEAPTSCSGLEVITACLPRNLEYVKVHGADHVFDYNSPTCAADNRELTKNRLFYAWDCFAEGPSPRVCADALSTEKNSSGGQPIYAGLSPQGSGRDDVTSFTSMAYPIFAEPFERGPYATPASQEDFEFAKKFVTVFEKLLADASFKTHQIELRSGGLAAIPEGLEDLKNYRVSSKKLVYHVE